MKYEFSAGGVVYKKDEGQIFILVSQHSEHHGWVFPKGFIGDKIDGETKEDTALREVKEETGVVGEIIESLKPVTYWYEMDGIKRRKTGFSDSIISPTTPVSSLTSRSAVSSF